MTERSKRDYRKSYLSTLVASATMVLLCGSMQAASEPVCTPVLAFKDVKLSEVKNHERVWTGTLSVDASKCTTTTGRFDLAMVRMIEHGPDMEFTESFNWRLGEISVSIKFHGTEAPLSYRIAEVATCACR